MLAIVIFIIFLGFLLLVHELGHFFVAKSFKVKVEEFGIGFPPRIWGKKIKGTIYSINALFFGGFVKILGEDGEDKQGKKIQGSFANQKSHKKLAILSAGVLMNFLFGIVFLSIGYMVGLPSVVSKDQTSGISDIQLSVLIVDSDSPAKQAGILAGDIILSASFGNEELKGEINVDSFKNFTQEHKGKEILLKVQRQEDILERAVLARIDPPQGKGAMGIAIAEIGIEQHGFFQSIWLGIKNSGRIFINTFKAIGYLIKGIFVETGMIGELIGPVGIVMMGGETVKLGLGYLLQFLAGLSINLAALNLIPFPALDGGRIIFILIEKIKGSPISKKVETAFHATGFLLLIGLLIFITARDVIRLF